MSIFNGFLSTDEQPAETDDVDGDDDDGTEVDPSLLDDPEQSILGESYQIAPTGHEYVGSTKALTHVEDDGGAVASPFIREMCEYARQDPQQHLWLGYDDDPQEGFREAGIPFEEMRKHLWISGASGSGKTTEELNLMTQLGYGGHGFVYFDPKGDDSRELLRMLPEDRLDDVVWVEPGSRNHEKTVQLNFLELPDWVRAEEREEAIEDRLQNLKAIFDTDEYWGINQESITETMGRAMMDGEEDYTIIDFFSILLEEDRREEFAASVDDPFVRAFCRQIAEMDDDTVRPLMKRVKKWAESPTVRQVIAARESTIDFREIVEDDKIVIVRTSTTNTDIKRMLALGVIRNVWSAVQHRSFADDADEHPYFIFCDEFDEIVSKNLDVESMLARARSKWLSLIIACQYPGQIAEKGNVLDAIENNCANIGAFRTTKKEDARILMNRFRKYDADVLLDSNEYELWTKLPQGGGRYSGGVKLNTFAPYPPLRDEDAIDEIIDTSLERYGAEPLSTAEIQQNLKFGRLGEMLDPENVDPDAIPVKRLLECVFIAAARENDDPDGTETVAFDRVHEEFERRSDVEITQAKLSGQYEEFYNEYVDPSQEDGSKLQLTDDGLIKLFEQDTGESETAGGPEHRYILRECFKTFFGLGADAYLPSQGGEELPDGVANLPISPLDDAETDAEYQELKAACKNEYGTLYGLSGGRDIAIEVETTTIQKPEHTLTNLRKAVEQGKKCVFACKDGSYDPETYDNEDDIPDHPNLFEYWARRGERIFYDTSGGGQQIETDYDRLTFANGTTDDGGRIFYSKDDPIQIEPGVVALRPDTSTATQWRERVTGDGDGNSGEVDTEIIMKETGGSEVVRAQFESVEQLHSPSRKDVPAYYEVTTDGYEVHANGTQETFETKDAMRENFTVIREPFVPECEFTDSNRDTRLPTEDDFVFVVYPDDNSDEYDHPHIYEQEEVRPFVPEDGGGTAASPSGEEETAQQAAASAETDSETEDEQQVESTDDGQQRHTPDDSRPNDDAATTATTEASEENEGHDSDESEQDTDKAGRYDDTIAALDNS